MRQTIALLFALCIGSSVTAAPVEHWFEQANRAYAESNFDSAATLYEKILESGLDNSTVYYNLGNALYRANKPGPARLAFERASKLDPDDPDILANIKFIQSNITDRVPEPERGFLETVLWKLHVVLPLKTQLWLAFGMWSILSLCIIVALFVSRNVRLWLIYLSVLSGIILCVLGGSITYKIYEAENVAFAVVLEKTIDAKNEPQGSTVLFTVHEGTKFRIRKIDGEWALVSLPNGVSGWVETKTLGTI
jgi:tetratricopeptide (TPR) repeat protein